NKSIGLWEVEIDPLTKKPSYGEENLIEIKSVEF
ncbi:unnamed protein product, partial [marine sediment metagenome]